MLLRADKQQFNAEVFSLLTHNEFPIDVFMLPIFPCQRRFLAFYKGGELSKPFQTGILATKQHYRNICRYPQHKN
jgi:hypothetical protein